MRTCAESHMRGSGTAEDQPVGVGPRCRVAVRGTQHQNHALAGRDRLSANGYILGGDPGGLKDWTADTGQFVECLDRRDRATCQSGRFIRTFQ